MIDVSIMFYGVWSVLAPILAVPIGLLADWVSFLYLYALSALLSSSIHMVILSAAGFVFVYTIGGFQRMWNAFRHPIQHYRRARDLWRASKRGFAIEAIIRTLDVAAVACTIILLARVLVSAWKFAKGFTIQRRKDGELESFKKISQVVPGKPEGKDKSLDKSEGEADTLPDDDETNLLEASGGIVLHTLESFITIMGAIPLFMRPSVRNFVYFGSAIRSIRIVFSKATLDPFIELLGSLGDFAHFIPGYASLITYLKLVKTKPEEYNHEKVVNDTTHKFVDDVVIGVDQDLNGSRAYIVKLWDYLWTRHIECHREEISFAQKSAIADVIDSVYSFSKSHALNLTASELEYVAQTFFEHIEHIQVMREISTRNSNVFKRIWNGANKMYLAAFVVILIVFLLVCWRVVKRRRQQEKLDQVAAVSYAMGAGLRAKPEGKGKTKHGRGANMKKRFNAGKRVPRPPKQLSPEEYDEWKQKWIEFNEDYDDGYDYDQVEDRFYAQYEEPQHARAEWTEEPVKYSDLYDPGEVGNWAQYMDQWETMVLKPMLEQNRLSTLEAVTTVVDGLKETLLKHQERAKVNVSTLKVEQPSPVRVKGKDKAKKETHTVVAPSETEEVVQEDLKTRPEPSLLEVMESIHSLTTSTDAFKNSVNNRIDGLASRISTQPSQAAGQTEVAKPESYINGSPLPAPNLHCTNHFLVDSAKNTGNGFGLGNKVMTAAHNINESEATLIMYKDAFGKEPVSAKVSKFPWQVNKQLDYAIADKKLVKIPGLKSYRAAVPKVGMSITVTRYDVTTRRWFSTGGVIDAIHADGTIYHTATTSDGDSGAAILNEAGQAVGIHLRGAPKGDMRNQGLGFDQNFINRLFPKSSRPSGSGA